MDYNDAAELAEEKIREYGTECRLVTHGEMIYDSESNSYIDNSKRQDGAALITSFEANLIDGTVILIGDVSILCTFNETVDIKPSMSKLEILNSSGMVTDTYQIINPSKIAPDGQTVILYKLHCRK